MSSLISPIFGELKTQIGIGPTAVVIDVLESETYTDDSQITTHPVQDGSVIADHIQDLPKTLQQTAFFGQSLTNAEDQSGASLTRAEDTYQKLLDLKAAKERLSVFTPRREYENMVIKRVTRPRSRADGDGIVVTIDFQEIQTATSEVVAAPPVRVEKNPKRRQGKKPKKEANEAQSQSAAAKIFDWIGG